MRDPDYSQTRRQVEKRLRGRLLFFANLVVFLLTLALAVRAGSFAGPAFAPVMIAWFALLVYHGVRTFNVWGRVVDAATERELQAETPTKAKRSAEPSQLTLGDDGEIEVNPEDDTLGYLLRDVQHSNRRRKRG
jgi:hypothetical protein